MKKKTIQSKKTKESPKKDQYMIVLEDLRSQFKVFGEDLMDVKKVVDSHSEILKSHTEMIGQILTDLSEIKNDMKQKVDRQEFARLEKRVIMLERRSR
jgi:hypothetical protein